MSIQTKKGFKNVSKAIAIALFALLMFTNIKIATMDSSELAKGDISIFGIQVTLFDATDAYGEYGHYETMSSWCQETDMGLYCHYLCMVGDPPECTGGDGYGYAN